MAPKNIRKRQLCVSFFFLSLLAICLVAGYTFRMKNSDQLLESQVNASIDSQSPTEAIEADVDSVLLALSSQTDATKAQLNALSTPPSTQRASLVFEGVADQTVMRTLLDSLVDKALQATFFFTSADLASHPDILAMVQEAGFSIGVSGLQSPYDWQSSQDEALVSDLCTINYLFLDDLAVQPSILLAQSDSISDDSLIIADACHYDEIICPNQMIDLALYATQAQVITTVAQLSSQSILEISLNSTSSAETIEWFLSAMLVGDATDSSTVTTLLDANNGAMAEPVLCVYTTQRAAAYVFSDLGNEEEVQSLLSTLRAIDAPSTFFVTIAEMQNCSDLLSDILADGHELGINFALTTQTTDEAILSELLEGQQLLSSTYAQAHASLVLLTYGYASDALTTAIQAGGFTLITPRTNLVKEEHFYETDANAIYEVLYGSSEHQLQRGEIVYFQMNQYRQSNTLLSELVALIDEDRNIYDACTVNDLLSNDLVYNYPLTEEEILPEVYNVIETGHLSALDSMEIIADRYIGCPWINTAGMMPGFTSSERRELDTNGKLVTDDDTVYLTFDDWGTDQSITAVLDVLAKHDIKATFFLTTYYIDSNPNLLRAIAMEGHTIGCHTHTHTPLSTVADPEDETPTEYLELTQEQLESMEEELITSYQIFQSIIGDIAVDGVPALSTLFRPPTLAVSKSGLETVFDCGYTYSVSGDYSTQDYKAESAEALASDLYRNIKSGTIAVMHISPNSIYTAEAIDLYIQALESRTYGNPFTFVSLIDVLNQPLP